MFGIRAAANFIAEAVGLAPPPPTERAGDLAGFTSTFYRDAARHETDHQLALSGGRRRITNNTDYLRDGGVRRKD